MAQNFKGDIKVQGTLILPNATPGKALEVDGSGNLTQSTTSTTELGYLSGVTSSIQTQINSKAADSAVIKKDGSVAYTADQSMGGNKLTNLAAPTTNGDALRFNELGANNGIATLDAGGKVPVSQLPNSIMEYKGTWNASTNSPTLADGTGNAGDVYVVSVAGTQNLGSGSITFAVGDWVMYNGSIWEKSVNSNAVASVNGQTGVVVLDSDDISEGATNLYFTDERAQDAVGTILVDGTTIDLTYNDATPSITAEVAATSLTNSHISASAAIQYSKLDLALGIVDGDINPAAAIALNKLATVTASRALQSDGSGVISTSSVTSTELGYVSGVTSAIQTQINSKAADSIVLKKDGSVTMTGNLNLGGNHILQVVELRDSSGNASVDVQNRLLRDTSGGTTSIDYANRRLTSSTSIMLEWGGTSIDAKTHKIVNVVDPTSAQDAATKNYVDSAVNAVPGDIPHTSFTYAGSVASPTAVTGLAFANATVRSFKAQVSVTNSTSGLYEVFELTGIQKASSWSMDQVSTGDSSLVAFTITNAGQIEYTNSDANSGVIKFRAQVLNV